MLPDEAEPDALSVITAETIAATIGINSTMTISDLCLALGLLRCPASYERLRELIPQAPAGRAEIDTFSGDTF